MQIMHYVGLDIHKKTISFCVKLADGTIVKEGNIVANRASLDRWMAGLPKSWMAAMEATMFTSWIYDHLRPHAVEVKVANPSMLKAISASKRKNDQIDAAKIADLARANLLPECYMAPSGIREARRRLRYRNLLVKQMTMTKNKVSAMLMECGIEYNKEKLHQKKYFGQLLETGKFMPESLPPLLRLSRTMVESFSKMEKQLVKSLEKDAGLQVRVARLMTIPGVGPITALSWALETGEIARFHNYKQAVSYCGLCGAEISSGGKQQRTPISKQRNKQLQTVLIEAAKLGPRHNPELAALHAKKLQEGGDHNQATLAVARKLVAWLLAVDRRTTGFIRKEITAPQAA
jgi:transposase